LCGQFLEFEENECRGTKGRLGTRCASSPPDPDLAVASSVSRAQRRFACPPPLISSRPSLAQPATSARPRAALPHACSLSCACRECIRGERHCIFASPLSWEGRMPPLLHSLLKRDLVRHSVYGDAYMHLHCAVGLSLI
jgi:hypothetical protein